MSQFLNSFLEKPFFHFASLLTFSQQMGRSRGEAGRRPMGILHARFGNPDDTNASSKVVLDNRDRMYSTAVVNRK
jgi:hypothetical protein